MCVMYHVLTLNFLIFCVERIYYFHEHTCIKSQNYHFPQLEKNLSIVCRITSEACICNDRGFTRRNKLMCNHCKILCVMKNCYLRVEWVLLLSQVYVDMKLQAAFGFISSFHFFKPLSGSV